MDKRNDTSPNPPGLAAIPEVDQFDSAAFDPCPIRRISAVSDLPPVILVVDDDPDVRLLLERLVQSLAPQYDIIATTDPADAVARMRGRTVPLMITDFSMPGMSGVELAAIVKSRAPQTQVLLITAYPTPLLEQAVQDHGIDYYLPKPFTFADLEHVMDTALQRDKPPGQQMGKRRTVSHLYA